MREFDNFVGDLNTRHSKSLDYRLYPEVLLHPRLLMVTVSIKMDPMETFDTSYWEYQA